MTVASGTTRLHSEAMGVELLRAIFEWLPLVFVLDLIAFHATGDHPLALRWWWRRAEDGARRHEGSLI